MLFMPAVASLACDAWRNFGAAVSGYRQESLATLLRDSEVAVLITADGTTRRGKRIPMKDTADEALEAAPV